MSERDLPIPDACQMTLEAIQADPLELPAEVQAHIRHCPACAEVRIQWLAQEEAPQALTPAGYFEKLPDRILRKLPIRTLPPHRHHPLLWAAASIIALGVGVGGFIAGKAHQSPMVEASMSSPTSSPAPDINEGNRPGTTSDINSQDIVPDMPFHAGDDQTAQLSALSPQEAEALAHQIPVDTTHP